MEHKIKKINEEITDRETMLERFGYFFFGVIVGIISVLLS